MNDFFSAGFKDDKFALLYNMNESVNIEVKTPVGKTNRQVIRNVITQGDVFGLLLCSKQVDTFGQECLDTHKYTFNPICHGPLGPDRLNIKARVAKGKGIVSRI